MNGTLKSLLGLAGTWVALLAFVALPLATVLGQVFTVFVAFNR
jgi:hypothetical protein